MNRGERLVGARQPDESGRATAAAMFSEVAPLFRGRSMAIEFGCGTGDVLLGHAGRFERLRGVDVAPENLIALEQRAADAGIANVKGFLPDQPWDEPTGVADYAYSLVAFRQLEDWVEVATYLQRFSMALRRGGIVQIQFDTRPDDFRHRVRGRTPQWLLPRRERRGARSVRRVEQWVRDRIRGADLEIIGERGFATAEHRFVARRR